MKNNSRIDFKYNNQIKMKKRIVSAAIMLMILTSAAFAGDVEIANPKVITSFQKEFVKASDVQWGKTNGLYKATFKMNDFIMYALFNEDGSLAGAYRSLVSSQLPIGLQSELRNQFSEYWITDLYEFSNTEGGGYYVSIENADQIMIMKSTNATNWQVFRKIKK